MWEVACPLSGFFFQKKENKLRRRILHTKGRFPRKLENHVDFLHAHFGNPRACDQSRFPHFFFLTPCLLWQSPKEERGGNLPPRSRMAHHQFSLLLFLLLLRVCVGIRVLCCRPPRLEEKSLFAGASTVVRNPPKWRASGVKFGTQCRMRYNTP